ncbi:phosphoribosylaminoimidazolesuccinocarboxamide synthase [Candidatus Paracaedibacter symbiosus]|uniref:phosphoribosylaminoimidazolesuccinocarboxamide synthase n=1 Tax=Candidatus Paracaedibacter symbiosus TaxID=244582 RepID=UPI000690EC74|nr:phosphoribosylaminoimidazolesuccinocarboxamide synthase [Candidatus Paracaedibacter symbiosus]
MAIRFLSPWLDHKKKSRRPQIFEGVTKKLFQGADPGTYVLNFKDYIESKDYKIHPFPGKGAMANKFSETMMSRFEEVHVATHFIKRLNMSEQAVKAVEMLPFRVVTHNQAVGDFAARLGIEEFSIMERPVIELHMKLRHQKDKIVTAMHLDALNWVRQHEIDYLYFIVGRINDNLLGQFQGVGLKLLSFSLEFGRDYRANMLEESLILVADELSPENLLVQDVETGKVLTIFEEDETGFTLNIANYLEIAKRFGVIPTASEVEETPSKVSWLLMMKERLENGNASKRNKNID